ncbi:hypothetical protein BDY21DRAFT_355403 [Lineolata rhizophorae]|uniref:Uncharacterized protein n=1 Tax=Lineolata rhizophorae TaxID=578093 RepID=A0A6A6NQ85_9PEZI|nr:hypothetical protein BDY21DRAFT_355403 [Lineolata rhizophorae]
MLRVVTWLASTRTGLELCVSHATYYRGKACSEFGTGTLSFWWRFQRPPLAALLIGRGVSHP